MGIPQINSEGVDQTGGSTAFTISFSGFSWLANDILEIAFATDGWVPVITTANGWQLAADPNGNTASVTTNGGTAGAADCGMFVYWKRAVGNTAAALDVPPVFAAPSGSSGTCWCLEPNSYTGARTSGTPYHFVATSILGTASTAVTSPNMTSTLANCLFMTRVASSTDDTAFNNWTMTGSAGPAAGLADSGWHAPAGNNCSYNGGAGGYATAGGPHNGTTTFANSTKQALVSLVMASLPEAAPSLSGWAPVVPVTSRANVLSAAAVAAAMSAPVVPPPSAAVPPMSWESVVPSYQLRGPARVANAGGSSAPAATLPNPPPPPLSWSPEFPDLAVRARAASDTGGASAPAATLPNPPPPPLSWSPVFPDAVARPRRSVIVGGATQPEATIPNTAPPGLGWLPTFPDVVARARAGPNSAGMTAPPFAGGASLTVGGMRVRQNILAALPFSTPLTTFGTDITFTAAVGTVLTAASHGMINCAGPFTLTTTGTLPGGTNGTTLYYCAQPTANTLFHLATSAANADAGTFVTMTDGGTGTHTLVRAVGTAPLYSTFVSIIERGTQSASPNLPTDSFGNTYAYVSGFPVFFAGFPASAVSIALKIGGVGGPLHTWSTSIGNVGGNQDEVLASGLEIYNARILQDSSVVERADNGPAIITSSSVTTTARALLVAVINGNSNVGQENLWTFFDGFTKLPYVSAEGDPDAAGYTQVCVAARYVDIKGTYTFRAQGTVRGGGGPSGGIMTLLAFQAQGSDLSPLDWLFPQADPPHVHRRGQAAGETAPPPQLGAVATPPLSWAPAAPDFARPRAGVKLLAEAAPPLSPVADNPVSWIASPPVAPVVPRRPAPGGEVAPPSDTNAGPLTWASVAPDHVLARQQPAAGGGEVAPLQPIPAAPALSWSPVFPDLAARAHPAVNAGGAAQPEATLPNPSAPPLSWSPVFPSSASRPRAAVLVGGAVQPEATLPNPPAPPLSWAPEFPDFTARARPANQGPSAALIEKTPSPPAPALSWSSVHPSSARRLVLEVAVATSGPAAPVFVPVVPPLASWSPVFADSTRRQLTTNLGAEAAPVEAISNPPAPPLSWSPVFPDLAARAHPAVNAGGAVQPVAAAPASPRVHVVPAAGRGVAGVSRGAVSRVGGVSRTGGVRVALPSPSGEWNPQWKDNVVDFDRDQFTRFIEDKGYVVTWEKAVLCPNVPGSGLAPRDHAIGCRVCGGSGFVYVDAISTRMLMQGVRLNQSFFAYGRWDMGNMLVTAEPEFTIDYFDRLTLGNGVGRFTQRLVRQPGTSFDALKYAPLCFHYAAWVDRSGNLAPFAADVDFRVSADGSGVEWSSSQPDAGSVYTVSYDYRPRYVVLDLIHHHRDSTVEGQHYQFPVQAIAKLDFLTRNEGADPQQVVDKNPFR